MGLPSWHFLRGTRQRSREAAAQAKTVSDMALGMFEESEPTRQAMFGNFEDIAAGRFDPTTSPMYAPSFAAAKEGISDQYGLAKENIMSNLPRGGAMAGALTDLELERAKTESGLPAMMAQQIIGDMTNKAYGAAFGQTPVAGLNMAGQLAAGQQQAAAQQESALYGGLGSLMSMLIMNYFGGLGGPSSIPVKV